MPGPLGSNDRSHTREREGEVAATRSNLAGPAADRERAAQPERGSKGSRSTLLTFPLTGTPNLPNTIPMSNFGGGPGPRESACSTHIVDASGPGAGRTPTILCPRPACTKRAKWARSGSRRARNRGAQARAHEEPREGRVGGDDVGIDLRDALHRGLRRCHQAINGRRARAAERRRHRRTWARQPGSTRREFAAKYGLEHSRGRMRDIVGGAPWLHPGGLVYGLSGRRVRFRGKPPQTRLPASGRNGASRPLSTTTRLRGPTEDQAQWDTEPRPRRAAWCKRTKSRQNPRHNACSQCETGMPPMDTMRSA